MVRSAMLQASIFLPSLLHVHLVAATTAQPRTTRSSDQGTSFGSTSSSIKSSKIINSVSSSSISSSRRKYLNSKAHKHSPNFQQFQALASENVRTIRHNTDDEDLLESLSRASSSEELAKIEQDISRVQASLGEIEERDVEYGDSEGGDLLDYLYRNDNFEGSGSFYDEPTQEELQEMANGYYLHNYDEDIIVDDTDITGEQLWATDDYDSEFDPNYNITAEVLQEANERGLNTGVVGPQPTLKSGPIQQPDQGDRKNNIHSNGHSSMSTISNSQNPGTQVTTADPQINPGQVGVSQTDLSGQNVAEAGLPKILQFPNFIYLGVAVLVVLVIMLTCCMHLKNKNQKSQDAGERERHAGREGAGKGYQPGQRS